MALQPETISMGCAASKQVPEVSRLRNPVSGVREYEHFMFMLSLNAARVGSLLAERQVAG